MVVAGERTKPDQTWRDAGTLLCERCGYVIDGLDHTGACPECGVPIASSLPSRRTGTPWQRSPRIRTLPGTWWATLVNPIGTLDRMICSIDGAGGLARRTNASASMVGSFALWLPAITLVPGSSDAPAVLLAWCLLFLGTATGLWGVFHALTWVEAAGLGAIAKTRGFRLGAAHRKAITAHGCAGWVLGAALFFLTSLGLHLFDGNPAARGAARSSGDLLAAAVDGGWLGWGLRVGAALIGFLFFETFAYIGLRRLRFANVNTDRTD
ncbi:MAG: hypothetical protein AAGA55_06080 [Planctomycetota bacterium]